MGGDFNLMRSEEDKSNDRINWPRIYMFNNSLKNWDLREVTCFGARFTWLNKQRSPVRCVLDRVFLTPELDALILLATVVAETSLGSDHTPLIFDSGGVALVRSSRFFFKLVWFEIKGFPSLVTNQWASGVPGHHRLRYECRFKTVP